MGNKHTEILAEGGGVFATQWSRKLPSLFNGREVMTMNVKMSSHYYFNTDHCGTITWHSHTFSLIMPHYDAGMKDKGMGSGWTSKTPPPSAIMAKQQQEAKLFLRWKNWGHLWDYYQSLRLLHPWALSEHWSSFQYFIIASQRFYLSMCSPQTHILVAQKGRRARL